MKTKNPYYEQVPRPFLLAAAALVALTLLLIAGTRITGFGGAAMSVGEAVAMRDLRFEDRPTGAIAVYAEPDNRLVTTLEPGSNGFLRGILRALVRERRQHGAGPSMPFRLMRASDGSLLLEDLATGRRLHLGAFGPTNAGAFADLLTVGSKQQ